MLTGASDEKKIILYSGNLDYNLTIILLRDYTFM